MGFRKKRRMESKKIEDPCPAPLAGTHIDDAAPQKEISVDRLIKMIAAAGTYGLHDVGLDILFANQDRLCRRFDIEEAAEWLVREHGHSTLTYHQYRTGTIPVIDALGVG
jgi:hypothetical protein